MHPRNPSETYDDFLPYRPQFANGPPPPFPNPRHTINGPSSSRHQPYHLQPDLRLPPPGTYPSKPISLFVDNFETHALVLLSPDSPQLRTLLASAKTARAASPQPTATTTTTTTIPPEDLVERALDRKTLTHVSDGPSGGIWAVDAGRTEIVSCLVLEMQGGWEVLGLGRGISEDVVFLRHPCGFGPEIEAEGEVEKELKGKGKGKGKGKERAEGGWKERGKTWWGARNGRRP